MDAWGFSKLITKNWLIIINRLRDDNYSSRFESILRNVYTYKSFSKNVQIRIDNLCVGNGCLSARTPFTRFYIILCKHAIEKLNSFN